MADVWKSQGRKFCEICKVWFGDNRASIEFHERGKKHKAALAAKLRDLGKKSKEEAKMKMQMSTALAAMEAAAMKSMREHGEGIPHGPALPATGLASKIFDPRLYKDVGTMARELARRKGELKEMKRSAPPPVSAGPAKYFRGSYSVKVDYPELSIPVPKQEFNAVASEPQQFNVVASEPSYSEKVWVEADAGDGSGSKYYFHMYTGESTWEKPLSFYTSEEYQSMFQSAEESLIKADAVLAAENCSVSDTSVEATVAEALPPVKSRHDETDNTPLDTGDIPLPGTSAAVSDTVTQVKQEPPSEDVQNDIKTQQEENVEESAPIVSQEQEIDKLSGDSEKEEIAEKPPAGPFGGWTRVTETNKEPVFSPLTAKYRAEEKRQRKEEAEKEKLAEKLEPKVEFTEKTCANLTKKVKGPIEFKKRSAAKHVRQRTQ